MATVFIGNSLALSVKSKPAGSGNHWLDRTILVSSAGPGAITQPAQVLQAGRSSWENGRHASRRAVHILNAGGLFQPKLLLPRQDDGGQFSWIIPTVRWHAIEGTPAQAKQALATVTAASFTAAVEDLLQGPLANTTHVDGSPPDQGQLHYAAIMGAVGKIIGAPGLFEAAARSIRLAV